ncbi:MAG: hypothetical protein HOV81_17030 [Kofleriaceae bacterium]|nr:hypothetical protein [Kofleriaceae bacterium]
MTTAHSATSIDAGGMLAKLEPPKPKPLVDIDWSTVNLQSDDDALALWQRIDPTGADWIDKLDELPDESPIAGKLAIALLHAGNFQCTPSAPAAGCPSPVDVPEAAPTANFHDPCLRRMLAMWAIDQLDDSNLPDVMDALRAIVALPPPESQLVAVAIKAIPESDPGTRLDLLGRAYAAGHRDIVNGMLGSLDQPQLIEAVQKHHIDGALEVLSAEANRPVYLAAITDDKLHPSARAQAIVELATSEDKMSPEVRTALAKATKSPDCGVAATAARFLIGAGNRKYAPAHPRTTKPDVMMRSVCVLASFEALQGADEPSYLLGYVPKKGLEVVFVTYDPYNETDDDGDGDIHTVHAATLVPRDEVVLPEIEDLIRAFHHCTGTVCRSDDREFRFTFKPSGGELLLAKLEVVELPPCKSPTP